MNKFNKLYNLILQSIITEGKEYQTAILKKSGLDDVAISNILKFLKDFNNKTADLLCKFIASEELTKVDDKRISDVENIIKLNPSIDTQNWKGTMDQFIQRYRQSINKANEKVAAKTIKYMDNIPQFTQKKEYDKGVVIYKVEDSEEGQAAVRKIVDLQWGRDANPWCIVSRSGAGLNYNYKEYWEHYDSFPKHIAFQNGKLLAFYASKGEQPYWWDREDHSHHRLPLLDDTFLDVGILDWTDKEIIQRFLARHDNVKLNDKTGLYDIQGEIRIKAEDLVKGHFPVKFGNCTGDFVCTHLDNLISLWGAPGRVGNRFSCSQCDKLTDLKGAPKYVEHSFYCCYCFNLKSLKGAPEYVGGGFNCTGCANLTNLNNITKNIQEDVIADKCDNLSDVSVLSQEMIRKSSFKECYKLPFTTRNINILQFDQDTQLWNCKQQISIKDKDLIDGKLPIKFGAINGDFECYDCRKLISLEGGPKMVNGSVSLYHCISLTSLIGAPEHVQKIFECPYCSGLTSLQGAPKYVGQTFNCSGCDNLTSLKGAPRKVKRFHCNHCENLTNLIGAPEEVETFECAHNHKLISLEGAPKVISKILNIQDCTELIDLKGLKDSTVARTYFYDCFHLHLEPGEEDKYNLID